MNRYELEHLIRAATGIIDRSEIVIIGSQAILGAHPEACPPLTESIEADVFSRDEPQLTDAIDGAIGEGSAFHATFGYYAHGVAEETATLPAGWKNWLVPVRNENTRGATGWCLEPHDLAGGGTRERPRICRRNVATAMRRCGDHPRASGCHQFRGRCAAAPG